MEVRRASGLRASPWKNGGGETREIAVSPAGAGLDDFDWRLSMATVASDGPFSIFEGIDRTLFLLDGAGITLDFADGELAHLAAGDRHDFAAERPLLGRLAGGPVHDLNLMVRRGNLTAGVAQSDVSGPRTLATTNPTLLFVEVGQVTANGVPLARHDTALLEPAEIVALDGRGRVIVITLTR